MGRMLCCWPVCCVLLRGLWLWILAVAAALWVWLWLCVVRVCILLELICTRPCAAQQKTMPGRLGCKAGMTWCGRTWRVRLWRRGALTLPWPTRLFTVLVRAECLPRVCAGMRCLSRQTDWRIFAGQLLWCLSLAGGWALFFRQQERRICLLLCVMRVLLRPVCCRLLLGAGSRLSGCLLRRCVFQGAVLLVQWNGLRLLYYMKARRSRGILAKRPWRFALFWPKNDILIRPASSACCNSRPYQAPPALAPAKNGVKGAAPPCGAWGGAPYSSPILKPYMQLPYSAVTGRQAAKRPATSHRRTGSRLFPAPWKGAAPGGQPRRAG